MGTKHSTKVRPCTCRHVFQDKEYGLNMRLHNVTSHDGKTVRTVVRCTVCGKEEIK